MGCIRLTDTTFCILYARMNHYELHLMVTSKSKIFQMNQNGNLVIFLIKRQMANVVLEMLASFSLL